MISFALTDIVIGYHSGTFFTWGSVFLIGLIANFFWETLISRISGALVGALIFFLVTNFGVWISGMYGYTLEGFINCYNLAIPFFAYSIISTLIFSFLIEIFTKVINLSWQGISKLSIIKLWINKNILKNILTI